MAVVAYFLFRLIAEASGPQAKIMTHNSLFFFFFSPEFHLGFLCFCSRGGGVSHSLPCFSLKTCVFVSVWYKAV